MLKPLVKCKDCGEYQADIIPIEGRLFVHCYFCGHHDYLKTFNKKYYEQTSKQFPRQSRR